MPFRTGSAVAKYNIFVRRQKHLMHECWQDKGDTGEKNQDYQSDNICNPEGCYTPENCSRFNIRQYGIQNKNVHANWEEGVKRREVIVFTKYNCF